MKLSDYCWYTAVGNSTYTFINSPQRLRLASPVDRDCMLNFWNKARKINTAQRWGGNKSITFIIEVICATVLNSFKDKKKNSLTQNEHKTLKWKLSSPLQSRLLSVTLLEVTWEMEGGKKIPTYRIWKWQYAVMLKWYTETNNITNWPFLRCNRPTTQLPYFSDYKSLQVAPVKKHVMKKKKKKPI